MQTLSDARSTADIYLQKPLNCCDITEKLVRGSKTQKINQIISIKEAKFFHVLILFTLSHNYADTISCICYTQILKNIVEMKNGLFFLDFFLLQQCFQLRLIITYVFRFFFRFFFKFLLRS